MGTETERQSTRNFNDNGYQVKLKNPLMGTETRLFLYHNRRLVVY